jgi:GWxTD domain-containing protein
MKPLHFLNSFLCLLFFTSLNYSQPDDKTNNAESFFTFDALNFYSPDNTGSRVDIYIEVPFDKVEFKKNKSDDKAGGNYSSDIDFTVTVLRKNGDIAFNKVYREVIKTEKTDLEFLSRNSQIITKNIFLDPAEYTIKVSSREVSSKKYYELQKLLFVKDFRSLPVSISDVMIVSKIADVQGKKYITPLASRNAGNLDTMFLFFFVYLNKEASSLKVNCKIFNSKNEEVFSSSQSSNAPEGLGFDNQFILTVPTGKFTNDVYKGELTAITPENSVIGISQFEYRWMSFPVSLDDIDLAIDQLQYIATDKELKKMRNAKSQADKQKRFMEFWKSKDPSPNTTRNEVMNEYYRRIEYANKNYSTQYTRGWKTDMGMVYIIFGLPNNVERHPYEMDTKPYEVWDYYELNRQFVFVDESGFGDYHLVTPIWDTFRYKN